MCWMALAPLGTVLTGGAATGTAAATIGTTTALSGLSTVTGIIGQRQQAKQQARFQEAASIQEQERLKQEQIAIRIRQDQETQARMQELFALQQRAKASAATAKVAAGEAGVVGSSVDLLLDDYYRQMGNYQYALTREQGFQNVATGLALQDAASRSKQTQIGINQPINSPGIFESVAAVGSSVTQGYLQGTQINQARGTPLKASTIKADTDAFFNDRYR